MGIFFQVLWTKMLTGVLSMVSPISSSSSTISLINETQLHLYSSSTINYGNRKLWRSLSVSLSVRPHRYCTISASLTSLPSTKLYVCGLSFRTTEESLRNAFENFGQLVEVNLVMDKIANRPRGFAFLRYATEEESQKAIKGMHGKFLDGRVIFVEVAKPRSELPHGLKQKPDT